MGTERISRREFLLRSAVTAAMLKTGRISADSTNEQVLAAGAGASRQLAGPLKTALDALGGIGRFIGGGERVMLLPNPQGIRTGASTRADLVAETVRMCYAAGASEVQVCSIHSGSRWSGTGIDQAAAGEGAKLWTPSGTDAWRELQVPGARRQKKVSVISPALNCDLLINMPIAKHHGSTRFTCTLKNLMGINAGNSGWHQGPSYLADSIVDLASIVRPQLHLVDVTEVLAENGPFGPGRNITPGRIVAGVDPVAVDTVCAHLVGMEPAEISTIARANSRGLGTMKLSETKISADLTTWYGA